MKKLLFVAVLAIFIFSAHPAVAGQEKKLLEKEVWIEKDIMLTVEVVELETPEFKVIGVFTINSDSKFTSADVMFWENGNQGYSASLRPETRVFISGKEIIGDFEKKIRILSAFNKDKAAMQGLYQNRAVIVDGHKFYRDYWREVRISPL